MPTITPSCAARAGLMRLLAPALAGTALSALAQTAPVPNAGDVLRQNQPAQAPALPAAPPARLLDLPVRPTLALPQGVTVQVARFRITGASSFTDDELQAVVKPWLNQRLDLRALQEAASAITRLYQSRGHLLSYAYLPAQRVEAGEVELAVLEGRIEAVQIVTAQDVRLRDRVVQALTDRLVGPVPVLQPDVERQMLLLNDIAGVTARAAFTPGATTGGAEMVVSVTEDDPLELRADLSNHGAISTGQYRVGVSLQLRDALGWGEQITARGLISNRGSLTSGTLGASLPVGGEGLRVGATVSRLTYELAASFKGLGAGTANSVALDAAFPVRRTPDNNVSLKAAFEHRQLTDRIGVIDILTPPRRTDSLDVGVSFDLRDTVGGSSAGSMTATMGNLRTGDTARRDWRRLAVQAARQQALWGPLSLYLRLTAQTGSNLDSADKMGLAGPNAVRAYAPGEASVDHGHVVAVELRHALAFMGGSLVTSVFHDSARGEIVRRARDLPGSQPELKASGLGLGWQADGYGVQASLAWRGSRMPTTDTRDPTPRLYVQFTVSP